eukprot:TRINITY_DN19236_c0_g1_i1.p1 TRINITY_DN19236_c0_g1~~TRINITY_DN19236_c0_g1_i1.p1  ORF type:complete len:1317 (-),score=210.55 TRINITY_DN19236_c0_g1_i1:279-4103(-)
MMPSVSSLPRCAKNEQPTLKSIGNLKFRKLTQCVYLMRPAWQHTTCEKRNNVNEIVGLLESHFEDQYQIFVLDHVSDRAGFAKFRDQALQFHTGNVALKPPPPMGILSGFCSSALFWLNLNRKRNVCVIQVGDSCSASSLLALVALLLAQDDGICVKDAVTTLRGFAMSENGGRNEKQAGTERGTPPGLISFHDPSAWPPSLQRYLGYLEKMRGRSKPVQTRRFCLNMISIDNFTAPIEDLVVEVYSFVFDNARNSDWRLLANSSNYEVQLCSPEGNKVLLDMSPDGHQPLIVQGDIAIVIRLTSNRSIVCRHFFHSAFIRQERTLFVELRKEDFDMDAAIANRIPDNLSVKIVLSDPDNLKKEQLSNSVVTSSQSGDLNVKWPRANRSQFSLFHVVEAKANLLQELEADGFEGIDAAIALQVNQNNPIKAAQYASRHFPMSTRPKPSRLTNFSMFPETQTAAKNAAVDQLSCRKDSSSGSSAVSTAIPDAKKTIGFMKAAAAAVGGWAVGGWTIKKSYARSPSGERFPRGGYGGLHERDSLVNDALLNVAGASGFGLRPPPMALSGPRQTRKRSPRRGVGRQTRVVDKFTPVCRPVASEAVEVARPAVEASTRQDPVVAAVATSPNGVVEEQLTIQASFLPSPSDTKCSPTIHTPQSGTLESETIDPIYIHTPTQDALLSPSDGQVPHRQLIEEGSCTVAVDTSGEQVPTPSLLPGTDGDRGEILDNSPSTKGRGKGPPPPPSKGKGKGKGKGTATTPTPKPGSALPLGKKFHWKTIAHENLENTVWAEITVSDNHTDPGVSDAHSGSKDQAVVLEKLFKKNVGSGGSSLATAAKAKAKAKNKGGAEQTHILDDRRAQNIAIITAGLGFGMDELYNRLKTLDTKGVSVDSIEKCSELLPNDEEIGRFQAFRGDPSSLRDMEQRLLPLGSLSRAPQRLKLMIFDLELQQNVGEVREDIRILVQAVEQARNSKQLRKILKVVLVLGNFVNFGMDMKSAMEEMPAKGFTVESLPRLIELKSPVHNSVTLLHYVAHLVLTSPGDEERVLADNPAGLNQVGRTSPVMNDNVVTSLRSELSSVGAASRISVESICAQQDEWASQLTMVSNELNLSSKYEAEAILAMKQMHARAEQQLDELTVQSCECEKYLTDLVHFFGEDPKKTTALGLFSALHEFVDQFSKVADEIRKRPAKFQMLLSTGNEGPEEEQGKMQFTAEKIKRRASTGTSDGRRKLLVTKDKKISMVQLRPTFITELRERDSEDEEETSTLAMQKSKSTA